MIKMPTYFIFVVALVFFGNIQAFAQLSNTGVKLFLDNNSILYITGNYLHKDGQVLNNGKMTVLGDWSSNNQVFEDASIGTVVFNNSSAYLTGTATFPHLIFKGNGSYYLEGTFNAKLSLDIEDAEIMASMAEALTLLNPDANALVRNAGYINTESLDGSFVRYMNTQDEYLYPLGTKSLKRFVKLKPQNADLAAFAISFIDKDPNTGGFNRASKAKSVAEINDMYYHKIMRLSGANGVDASFLIPLSEKYQHLVTWVKSAQWDRAHSSNSPDKSALLPYLAQTILYKNADLPLGSDVGFALAQVNNVGPFEFYNAFSPDGDGKNDTWEVKNIDAFPDNDLKIFDRSGNLVYRMSGYNSSKYWDGQNVSSGTYIYILRVKIDGQDQHFKGSITMVKK